MMPPSIRHLAAGTNTSPFTVTRSLRQPTELQLDQRGHFRTVAAMPSSAWCVRLPATAGNGSTRGGMA